MVFCSRSIKLVSRNMVTILFNQNLVLLCSSVVALFKEGVFTNITLMVVVVSGCMPYVSTPCSMVVL